MTLWFYGSSLSSISADTVKNDAVTADADSKRRSRKGRDHNAKIGDFQYVKRLLLKLRQRVLPSLVALNQSSPQDVKLPAFVLAFCLTVFFVTSCLAVHLLRHHLPEFHLEAVQSWRFVRRVPSRLLQPVIRERALRAVWIVSELAAGERILYEAVPRHHVTAW